MAKAKKAKSKVKAVPVKEPLFELHVRLDELADLSKMISARLGDVREKIAEAAKQVREESPEKAIAAGQTLVNFLGKIGIEEVKFRGQSFKPEETSTKG